jgi:hypothetical protein
MTGILEGLAIGAATSLLSAGLTYLLSPSQTIEGNRLQDLTTGRSNYGANLPYCWGKVRVGGNLIWTTFLNEVKKTSKQGKGGKIKQTDYTYYGSFALAFTNCQFRPVADYQRLWMNRTLVYSKIGGAETISEGGKFAEQYLSFYYGGENQGIDPLLQNVEPISNYNYGLPAGKTERDAFLASVGLDPSTTVITPAYNYRSYIVANRIPLGDFFNSIPQVEAELVASQNCTVGQIMTDIFGLIFDPQMLDTSLISTSEFAVDGFFINSVAAAKQAVQNLQQAYFIDIIKSNGQFKFIPLNHQRTPVNLDAVDLGSYEESGQKPLDFAIKHKDATTLPSECFVNYIDADLNYDQNQQRAIAQYRKYKNDNKVELTLNIVMSAKQAAQIATRTLFLELLRNRTYEFSLPPAFLALEPADLVPNHFDDTGLPIIIDQIRLGANFLIECTGYPYDASFFDIEINVESGDIRIGVASFTASISFTGTLQSVSNGSGTVYQSGTDYTVSDRQVNVLSSGNIPQGTQLFLATTSTPVPSQTQTGAIVSAGNTELLVLDIPLINNEHQDYSLYLTGGGGNRSALAADSSPRWSGADIYLSTDNSRYSYAVRLPTYGIYGSVTIINSGTYTVVVNKSELESITDSDLALGFNLCVLGNQIAQFKTANIVNTNTYELSQITFGLRGTETQAVPVIGDRFVLLQGESAELQRIVGDAVDIGEVRYFKAVSAGQSLTEVTELSFTIQGIAQRTYAPVNLSATKDGVGNITLSWDRRDRHGVNINNPPLSELVEEYAIEILNESIVTRLASVSTNSYVYDAADQQADFGALQSSVKFRVAQVSADVGNGSFAAATLTPSYAEPQPNITSFSPISSTVGSIITIIGQNLAQVSQITVGAIVQANLAVVSNTEITFQVAPSTETEFITVTTSGGIDTAAIALIITQPTTSYVLFPGSNPQTLPYTIVATDAGTEIIINAQTDILSIPNDATGFDPGWNCLISLDGIGTVTIQREDLTTTGIVGTNTITNNQTVQLWHRGGNIWKIGQ